MFTGSDRYGVAWGSHALGDATVAKGLNSQKDWRLFGAGSWGGNTTPPASNGYLPNTQDRLVYAMSEVLTVVDPSGGGGGLVITSISVSGNTSTLKMEGTDGTDYWCASSTDLTGFTTEETTSLGSPFQTTAGVATFTVDVTGDSELFLRVQDTDPVP